MKTIPLNIMMTYPVKWDKKSVLRDIVQNFYDDSGASEFGSKFKHQYLPDESNAGGRLVLSMDNTGFNYEWLLHIGATTKQEKPGKYAGFYGEGFKMAALCALRDHKWKVSISSKNWLVEVCRIETEIDGKKIGQLAYNVEESETYANKTVLMIDNFSQDDYAMLEAVIWGFYYAGNPLIGELIYSNEYVALHKRTKKKKHDGYIHSYDCDGEGIVFLCYQARGSFNYPLVICDHRFQTSTDRERKNISFGTIIDVLLDMADMIDVKTCCYLLEQFKKHWYDYPKNTDDVDSYYSLIKKLIRKIWHFDSGGKTIKGFKKKYPNLAICEKPRNAKMRNQKTQALEWRKAHMPECLLVQDSFEFLGYETIVSLCEKAGGFNFTRKADDFEFELLGILQKAAIKILHGFILTYPECLVIENETSICDGTANVTKIKDAKDIKTNNKGHKIRYNLEQIEIKKKYLEKTKFMAAFTTYCHELCHCFGGDSSASFSRALTDVIELTGNNSEELKHFQNEWEGKFQ